MKLPTGDPKDTQIASSFTVRQYEAARDAENRVEIAEAIRRRFTERYVTPTLQPKERHGFTMMAISCLMIEAFVSLQNGWKTSDRKGEQAVSQFFAGSLAFGEFKGYEKAFYRNVRCGILHQAETRKGWKISRTGPLFELGSHTINAEFFLQRLKNVLDTFCDNLKTLDWNSLEWKSVRKKMKTICENCKP